MALVEQDYISFLHKVLPTLPTDVIVHCIRPLVFNTGKWRAKFGCCVRQFQFLAEISLIAGLTFLRTLDHIKSSKLMLRIKYTTNPPGGQLRVTDDGRLEMHF